MSLISVMQLTEETLGLALFLTEGVHVRGNERRLRTDQQEDPVALGDELEIASVVEE